MTVISTGIGEKLENKKGSAIVSSITSTVLENQVHLYLIVNGLTVRSELNAPRLNGNNDELLEHVPSAYTVNGSKPIPSSTSN